MTDDGDDPSDAADVDERVVEFLVTADPPRHLASEVSESLDLARGQVRTRLQALAADGRVVRTDAEGTARWAVPDRADEPDADPGDDADETTGTDGVGSTGVADDDATGTTPEPETPPEPENPSEAAIAPEPSGTEGRHRGSVVVRAAIVILGLAVAGAALRHLRRRR